MNVHDIAHQWRPDIDDGLHRANILARSPRLVFSIAAHGTLRRALKLGQRGHYYLYVRRRYRQLRLERVEGRPLIVLPGVFNPRLFRTGEMLARHVGTLPVRPGTAALDLGCGSGAVAIAAARAGMRVVAVDINREAVRCTRINALLNGVEHEIDTREGDLFEPVHGERFDLVLFNPPYFPGRAREPWEHAWRSENTLERFVAGLPRVLASGGRALVILSTVAHGALETLKSTGMNVRTVAERQLLAESLFIVEVMP